MARLDELAREIAEVKATAAAAASKLQELAARIEACECDPEKLAALVAELNEAQEGLQSTVDSLTETPVPPPVEDPVPEEPVV